MRRLALPLALIAGLPCTLAAQQMPPVLEARVFMDFNYLESNRDSAAQGFQSGQLAGHLVAGLSERFTFFGEVTATPVDSRFNVEVERATVRYDHADWLRLSGGRYHNPISYWNTSFHHGQWLQTTVSRPQVIRFGGTFLPVHFVGVMADGRVASGGATLHYTLGVGNGRHGNLARAGDAGDVNDSYAVTAATSVSVPGRTGLHMGVAYYADRVTPEDSELDLDERILSAHLARERETPELFLEYTRVEHEPRAGPGGRTRSEGYYGQVAYRLPGAAHRFKPYLRAERLRTGDDPLFAPLDLDYEGVIGGIRFDAGPATALKLEYRSERFGDQGWTGTLAAQLSFTFSIRRQQDPDDLLPPPAAPEHGHGDR